MDRVAQSRMWVAKLREAAVRLEAQGRCVAFMEVCGTHTVSACRCGLHSVMPANVKLLSGPGCPVCVTAQGDIDQTVELALRHPVTVCTYGDMVRVPGECGSLEWARGQGADVRVIYSAMDAVRCAAEQPRRQVVFAAVGFETTTPATAAAVLEADRRGLTNFTVLSSHKLIIPAMRGLLAGGRVKIDGFLCPGHVAVVIGSDAFAPIASEHRMPCVIAGFEDAQIAAGLAHLVMQAADGRAEVENLYPEAVTRAGNRVAQMLIEQVFEPADVTWRALGVLPGSGLRMRKKYALYDATVRYGLSPRESRDPRGCRCGDVITGRASPGECGLFGTACTPIDPVGPCMVSPEGTCQAWFRYRRLERGRAARAQGGAA